MRGKSIRGIFVYTCCSIFVAVSELLYSVVLHAEVGAGLLAVAGPPRQPRPHHQVPQVAVVGPVVQHGVPGLAGSAGLHSAWKEGVSVPGSANLGWAGKREGVHFKMT